MLIIAGTIDVDPDQMDDFLRASIDMMRATHEEPGCLAYSFTVDQLVLGRIQLFEKWESNEDLAAHFEAPHMAVFQQRTGALTIMARDILKYQIASEGPVR